MAFLGGVAFAGIVVFVLLRTGAAPGQPNLSAYPLVQTPPTPPNPSSMTTVPLPPPTVASPASPTAPDPAPYYGWQQLEAQRLRDQLEQQRNETEQLKAQLKNQQLIIDTLSAQARANTLSPNPGQAVAPAQQQSMNPLFTGIVWALGGMVVTLIGGIILIGAFALFSLQQRPPRTVQVIHPIPTPQPPMQPRYRSEFLPPRLVEGRRTDTIDYDRYDR